MVECSIPESVVNVLMVRAKQQDSIMSCLRSICYPANIWIPCRETHNRSPFKKLLLMGWTKQVVDDARVIIYNFISDEIGGIFPVSTQCSVNKMSGSLGIDLFLQGRLDTNICIRQLPPRMTTINMILTLLMALKVVMKVQGGAN
jgi:hypothetical protein